MSCSLNVDASQPGGLHAAARALVTLLAAGTGWDAAGTGRDDVVVCLGPGSHVLSAPLVLTSEHNHPRGGRVVWRGVGGATTVSAGVALDNAGWLPCGDGGPCPAPWESVWYHALPANTTFPPRQLWVDGARAARTAVAGATLGLTNVTGGYATTASSNETASWVADGVEFRWPRQVKNWIEPRCVVSAVTDQNLIVDPDCWTQLSARNVKGGVPVPAPVPELVENVATRPPGAGEFVSTKSLVFYRPPADDPYRTPTNAVVSSLETIVNATKLENHAFEDVTWSHATWLRPNLPAGYVPDQSAVTPFGDPPAAISIATSTNVTFETCVFQNLGTPYALAVDQASRECAVRRCSFKTLAGGALRLGNLFDASRVMATDPSLWDSDFEISDNSIESTSLEFRGCSAVFAGVVRSTSIEHNSILDAGYTGISLGWGWGNYVTGEQTFMQDNHVVGNRIVGVMSALNDGGCVYTLGPQPGSTVRENYCASDRAPVVGSFYHDNGSRYFNTTDNVAETSPAPCLYLQGCCGAPALDIDASNLWCRDEGAIENGCAPAASNCSAAYPGLPADCHCHVDNATVYLVASDAPWPAAAQAIVDAAGPR
mmetsp:Transcript_17326/g.52696  ORF Transcript_17326/g.52696 Transcript_17326/m.52696 type:complete len:600 (+) Transcript_17326:756-2555(+)